MCTSGNHSDAFLGRCNFFLVFLHFLHNVQRRKSISLNCLAEFEMLSKKLANSPLRNRVNGLHCQKSCCITSGFNGHKNRLFASGASSSFSSSFAAHIGVIKFDQILQAIDAITMSHCRSDFRQDIMSRRPGNAKELGCSKSRQASFVGSYQENCPEPFDQWQFCRVKQGICCNRNLMSTLRTLMQLPCFDIICFLRSTLRTLKTIGPSDFGKFLYAGSFSSIALLPFQQRHTGHLGTMHTLCGGREYAYGVQQERSSWEKA